nr:hypothetical protein [Tanacetum cinerariifolium]
MLSKVSPWKGMIRFRKRGKLNPRANETFNVPQDEMQITDKLQFIEELLTIIDRDVKRLKHSWIPIIKVWWNSRRGPEFTCKRNEEIKRKYPHLFTSEPSCEGTS